MSRNSSLPDFQFWFWEILRFQTICFQALHAFSKSIALPSRSIEDSEFIATALRFEVENKVQVVIKGIRSPITKWRAIKILALDKKLMGFDIEIDKGE